MNFRSIASILLATTAVYGANAAPREVRRDFAVHIADIVKADHPKAYAAFLAAPKIVLDTSLDRRQEVPVDGNPNSTRPITTPENIFVLQCSEAGFQGDCLSWGAPPGRCVNYFNFNNTQEFLNKWENQTSSLSTNTGGLCQFYKFSGCNNKGDDRGVTLSYNYNLAEKVDGYSGDYDNQISSWRC
ncbi:hypothetical protein CCHL11_03106 [Colletotrichum chlorophyti]|uniref:Secreted protein n=1 Tax=Colletotrichum chlorophyti TaxID=708187 RepID=A0A1Q8RG55_9PEZI|nr:hypothetical protein CCHL11_03106 [Colletotrichum chlorophyti]